jgi:hypothetical protein
MWRDFKQLATVALNHPTGSVIVGIAKDFDALQPFISGKRYEQCQRA